MKSRFKNILAALLSLSLLTGGLGAPRLQADPLQKLGPDESLYQRVKQLGDEGLLDPQDAAVLDRGTAVTRLQLAFYVEKAQTRIQSVPPYTPAPTPTEITTEVPTPAPTPVPTKAPRHKKTRKAKPAPVPTPVKKKKHPRAAVQPVENAPTPVPAVTEESTAVPTEVPTEIPAAAPAVIEAPAAVPDATEAPTAVPAVMEEPTAVPTEIPTAVPVVTEEPTAVPTPVPTEVPTEVPALPIEAPQAAEELIQPPPPAEAAVAPAPALPVLSHETPPTYTWQEGDDMKSVAKKLYGTADLSPLLEQANKDLMDHPDQLKAGRVIQVPPAPTPGAPTAEATAAPTPVPDELKNEIKSLLKELRQEDTLLKSRLKHDERLTVQTTQATEDLKPLLNDLNRVYMKSDRSSGSNHMDIAADMRVDNIGVAGITQVSSFRATDEIKMGLYGDLNGKGTAYAGFGAVLPTTGSTAGNSVSLYINNPSINYNMDGMLGHWENNLVIEDYTGDVDLGDFVRGAPAGTTRFETPFDIKKYADDKSQKCWDDYMTQLGYVPGAQTFQSGSTSYKVFDGLYLKGSKLPLLGQNALLTLLAGPADEFNSVSQGVTHNGPAWEEGGKLSQSWLKGKINTNISAIWMNTHFGLPTYSLDMNACQADLGFDMLPVFFELEESRSSFYTGVDTEHPADPSHLFGNALQATATYYPFIFYFTSIDPNYSNYWSKVTISGIDYHRFGFGGSSNTGTSSVVLDRYGYIGMADTLVSDRQGGRINLGWKGRQSPWMKSWPKFLDYFIFNGDAAVKTEQRSVADSLTGYNNVDCDYLVTMYYPDDNGLWGNNLWGGYNGAHPIGQAYENNITDMRDDGMPVTLRFGNGTSERVPLILPVLGADGLPVTNSAGHIEYTPLTHQKTYQYLTGTLKVQFNKFLKITRPFYGGFFATDNKVSGATSDPNLAAMPDPNRPGRTLQNIPNLFDQRVYDASMMLQVARNVNASADYAYEKWTSHYTSPTLDRRTFSQGLGLSYDLPWGGSKFEVRYKHVKFRDAYVLANNYNADQVCAFLDFKF